MFQNYLKIAIRNILKNKAFSFIIISGLAIGMACTILIQLWVKDELSYDRFHKNAEQIYRVTMHFPVQGENKNAMTPMVLAPKLNSLFPEIQRIARLKGSGKVTVSYENRQFYEDRFFLADTTIFYLFSFEFIRGSAATALLDPYSVIITESTANKYFGDADPIGKALMVENKDIFKISAIIKNIPSQSHFHFDFLGSFAILGEIQTPWKCWGYTYILLPKDISIKNVNEKFNNILIYDNLGWEIKGMNFRLQPLTDIHFYSYMTGEIEATQDIRYLYILSTVALLILLIACVNFMNMSTARSIHRLKEVGIRKVFGSQRYQLFGQFLGESILISLVALLVAIILIKLLLPYYNDLVQKEIHINFLKDSWLFIGCLIIAVVVGIISGSYPGLFLSSFRPILIFKGIFRPGRGAPLLRKILVVIQFTITIAMIGSTLVIQNQLKYIRNKKLGFQKENIVTIPIRDNLLKEKIAAFKNELRQIPVVVNVSAANATPFSDGVLAVIKENRFQFKFVDHDFISTLGLEIVEGRNFSGDITTDSSAFILNESAVKLLEMQNPIGKEFKAVMGQADKGTIIGVVKDFHNNSLYHSIEPLAFQIYPEHFDRFFVKIRTENVSATLDLIEQKWCKFVPYRPFEFEFLNEEYDRLYHDEQQMGKIFNYFSLLAILLACQGLFGLAAFAAEQRTREIGIRKVLGASIARIVYMLTQDFTKWVLLANLVALPITYFVMNKWLQNFAYRIKVEWWTFLLAGLIALVIALLTVSYQAIRAATADPVEALRYE